MDHAWCPLDERVLMILVDPDEEPDEAAAVKLVTDNTLGFAVWGEGDQWVRPAMVLDARMLRDDEFTADHILAVMAHELAHINERTEDEPTADRIGALILRELGHVGAAKLLEAR